MNSTAAKKPMPRASIITEEANARRYEFQGRMDGGKDWISGLCRTPQGKLVWLGFDYLENHYFERDN